MGCVAQTKKLWGGGFCRWRELPARNKAIPAINLRHPIIGPLDLEESMNKKPSNSIRKKKAELLSRCLVLYSLGLDYSQYADELAGLGTDKDWKDLEDRLNQVDEWMMDAGCATLAQVERVKARREKRPQRPPSPPDD
jgi:hypothetical protein